MKRLTSLVLALLLALTMMVGAFAETADVTGEWYGELLGIQVTLTINADGTYKMDIAGMDSEEGVWEKNEDGNLVMDKGTDGEGLVTVTETGLSTEQDGMKIDFTREAPAEDEELTISTETPFLPARPVRPERCSRVALFTGISAWMTRPRSGRSMPRAATLVATQTRACPSRRA